MVQKVRIISSRMRYDNRNDEQRVYDMEASARVTGTTVNSLDDGRVLADEVRVANFNWWDENNLSITYENLDTAAQASVNEAVNAFITEVRELAKTQNS